MDDLSRFRRLNSGRPDRGVRGGTNPSVRGRRGKAAPFRLLRRGSCGRRFSERKGTPLFRSRPPPEKANAVLERVAEGRGVRQTGRLAGARRDTVARPATTPRRPATSWSRFPPLRARGSVR